jgi:hypothetical protein
MGTYHHHSRRSRQIVLVGGYGRRMRCMGVALLLFALPAALLATDRAIDRATLPAARPETAQQTPAQALFATLPLAFEQNRGQADPAVRFLTHTRDASLLLAPDTLTLAFTAPHPSVSSLGSGASVRFAFVDANPAPTLTAERPLPGVVNYVHGNDPARWQRDVPTSERMRYGALYPGVDLVVYGDAEGQWEYDVEVAAGADPARFALRIEGATGITLDADGALAIPTAQGALSMHAPVAYQDVGGERRGVAAGYLLRDDGTVGFSVGGYDRTLPLVIDPIVYSTYLGGSGADAAAGIAVDTAGNTYVTGYTISTNFPVTNGSTLGGGNSNDAFVTKLDGGGTRVYSTYLGGTGDDRGTGIAVDTSGNAYITGHTNSTDFPVTNGSIINGTGSINSYFDSDAFVTKLNGSGTRVYSTYLGGAYEDDGYAIAVDASGNAYVTGITASPDFPVTNGSIINGNGIANGTNTDAFVSRLDTNGVRFSGTYLGGSTIDLGTGIAVDSSGYVYVTGYTNSTDFTRTTGMTFGGVFDTFVTRLGGTSVSYSTYLGGNGDDEANAIAVDAIGNVYVTGKTQSTNFPVTDGSTLHGNQDAFVFKLNGNAAPVYSTYLGGNASDLASGIAVDTSGDAYVTGVTIGPGFPITDGSTSGGGNDAFVTEFNGSGARIFSGYLGGISIDAGTAIAVDASGHAYVTGYTNSANFPVTNGSTPGGLSDAFVAKISVVSPVPNPLPQPKPAAPVQGGPSPPLPLPQPPGTVGGAPNPLPPRRP